MAIAAEILAQGQLPLILWISPQWDPKEHVLYTKGMPQFGAPEIFIGQQRELSLEMSEYLFNLANYVLTSGNALLEGETIDGPGTTFKIEFSRGHSTGKRGLLLLPVHPN